MEMQWNEMWGLLQEGVDTVLHPMYAIAAPFLSISLYKADIFHVNV